MNYMAPEIIQAGEAGEKYDYKVDLWSLAVIMSCLTARLIYIDLTKKWSATACNLDYHQQQQQRIQYIMENVLEVPISTNIYRMT